MLRLRIIVREGYRCYWTVTCKTLHFEGSIITKMMMFLNNVFITCEQTQQICSDTEEEQWAWQQFFVGKDELAQKAAVFSWTRQSTYVPGSNRTELFMRNSNIVSCRSCFALAPCLFASPPFHTPAPFVPCVSATAFSSGHGNAHCLTGLFHKRIYI